MQYPSHPDIVVIGAGAAGIGAGLALTRAQIPFVIVEAKDRVGGRAFTDTTSIGHPWDHAATGSIRADNNVLRVLAEKVDTSFRRTPRAPIVNR